MVIALGGRLLRPSAKWKAVFNYYALCSLIYVYLIFGGSFAWYLFSPVPAAILGGGNRVVPPLLIIGLLVGLGLMLLNVKLLPL